MRGLKLSELELTKMADAGIALSLAAANKQLVKQLGLAHVAPKIPLWNLHMHSLPESFMAVACESVLETNIRLIASQLTPPMPEKIKAIASDGSQILEAALPDHPAISTINRRTLVLAFDKTYVLQGLDIVQLRCGKGFVGSAFPVDSLLKRNQCLQLEAQDAQDQSWFLPMRPPPTAQNPYAGWGPEPEGEEHRHQQAQQEQQQAEAWDTTQVDHASEICEFLCWNPAMQKLPRFSACCVPMSYTCDKYQMLLLCGHVLAKSAAHVRTVVFDNASNHALLKKFFLGQKHHLSEEELRAVPFFRDIEFKSFPQSCLPRFPFRRPMIGQDALCLD